MGEPPRSGHDGSSYRSLGWDMRILQRGRNRRRISGSQTLSSIALPLTCTQSFTFVLQLVSAAWPGSSNKTTLPVNPVSVFSLVPRVVCACGAFLLLHKSKNPIHIDAG